MKSFTYECLDILDVCNHNSLDYNETMESISNSNVSYGTNADTLITGTMLNSILETTLDFGEYGPDILISLGS